MTHTYWETKEHTLYSWDDSGTLHLMQWMFFLLQKNLKTSHTKKKKTVGVLVGICQKKWNSVQRKLQSQEQPHTWRKAEKPAYYIFIRKRAQASDSLLRVPIWVTPVSAGVQCQRTKVLTKRRGGCCRISSVLVPLWRFCHADSQG